MLNSIRGNLWCVFERGFLAHGIIHISEHWSDNLTITTTMSCIVHRLDSANIILTHSTHTHEVIFYLHELMLFLKHLVLNAQLLPVSSLNPLPKSPPKSPYAMSASTFGYKNKNRSQGWVFMFVKSFNTKHGWMSSHKATCKPSVRVKCIGSYVPYAMWICSYLQVCNTPPPPKKPSHVMHEYPWWWVDFHHASSMKHLHFLLIITYYRMYLRLWWNLWWSKCNECVFNR